MDIELTPQEREHLIELLENEHKELLHALHHSSTRAFTQQLRTTLELNEAIEAKVRRPALVAV